MELRKASEERWKNHQQYYQDKQAELDERRKELHQKREEYKKNPQKKPEEERELLRQWNSLSDSSRSLERWKYADSNYLLERDRQEKEFHTQQQKSPAAPPMATSKPSAQPKLSHRTRNFSPFASLEAADRTGFPITEIDRSSDPNRLHDPSNTSRRVDDSSVDELFVIADNAKRGLRVAFRVSTLLRRVRSCLRPLERAEGGMATLSARQSTEGRVNVALVSDAAIKGSDRYRMVTATKALQTPKAPLSDPNELTPQQHKLVHAVRVNSISLFKVLNKLLKASGTPYVQLPWHLIASMSQNKSLTMTLRDAIAAYAIGMTTASAIASVGGPCAALAYAVASTTAELLPDLGAQAALCLQQARLLSEQPLSKRMTSGAAARHANAVTTAAVGRMAGSLHQLAQLQKMLKALNP